MNQYQSVIQLARQSALKRFSVMVQRMAQNSDQELARALAVNSPSTDYATLNSARFFLRKAGDDLLRNIEALYQQKMEQAFQAMLSNERVEVSQITAANLTLIDDSTIDRQIEVGHLVGRLSASCSESLSLVNIIMSQLLGKTQVREKDNPFRPDLMAYTLHEVFSTMVAVEGVRNFLLNYSTNSLAIYLPEYYIELCEIFKSGGISPKIFTRPTSGNPYHSESHARPTSERRIANQKIEEHRQSGAAQQQSAEQDGMLPSAPVAPELVPMMQRILSLMQQQFPQAAHNQNAGQPGETIQISPLAAFQGLVNNLYGAGTGGGGFLNQGGNGLNMAGASPELLALLNEFQKRAAGARGADSQPATSENPLASIAEQLDSANASPSERMAMDLVGVLFELISRDEQLPEGLREQMARLQIPFLKSAVLDPGTLEQVDHPTRKLLNHMGMVSVGVPGQPGYGQGVDGEIKRIVKTILADFNNDTGIFVTCLDELKKFMSEELRRADAINKSNIEAMEEVQRTSDLTYGIKSTVRDMLQPLNLDPRVSRFCMDTWVQVLVKASSKIIKAKGEAEKTTRSKLQVFFNALPELVWSAQEKATTEDRLALIKLLPKLVKIIKSGMKALQFSDEDAQQSLDQLLAVHAHVLANNGIDPKTKLPTLDELRQMFKVEVLQEDTTTSRATAPPPLDAAAIQAALAKKGITAIMHINSAQGYGADLEHEWLADMQVGTRIEWKMNDIYNFGRLIWVDKHQSLYMFRMDKSATPLIYCPVSLSRALREGTITFVETAPTFERAIESLLQNAKNHEIKGGEMAG